MKFSNATLAKLPEPARRKGSAEYTARAWYQYDDDKALWAVRFPDSLKFYARGKTELGERFTKSIGRWDGFGERRPGDIPLAEARRRALKETAHGYDEHPAVAKARAIAEREKDKAMPSAAAFAKAYLEGLTGLKKTTLTERHAHVGQIVERWGKRPVNEITQDDVKRFYQFAMKKRHVKNWNGWKSGRTLGGIPTANRLLVGMFIFFDAARIAGHIEENPVHDIKREKEHRRERTSFPKEAAAFLASLNAEPPRIRTCFSLFFSVPVRLDEVLSAKWGQFDLDRVSEKDGAEIPTWIVPNTAKPNETMPKLLPPAMAKMLRDLGPGKPGEYLFPGRSAGTHISDTVVRDKWFVRVCGHAEPKVTPGKKDDGVTIHDIRRTVISRLAAKFPIAVVAAAAGHKSIKSTMLYTNLNVDDQRILVAEPLLAGGAAAMG